MSVEKPAYDMWLGSDLGLVKGVILAKDCFTNYGDIKTLDKSQSITCMALQHSAKQNNLVIGLRSGVIRTFDTLSCAYKDETFISNASPVRGIIAMSDGSVVSCTESGCLQRWKDGQSILEKNVGPDIKALSASSSPEMFATGGIENELKVWQIENMDKPLFIAKNVKNDFLNLRVPVWVSAIDFFKKDNHKIVVASGNHTVRVYDRRERRRPVLDSDWHEHPITACHVKPGNMAVLLGNSAGYMSEVDLRTGKQVGAFKGNAGSIRAICVHPTQPIVAACGLDRFLKIYDVGSRKLIKKIYTKSSLNCMLMNHVELQLAQTTGGEKRERIEDRVLLDEDDKMWNSMTTIKDQPNKQNKMKTKKKKK